MIDFPVKVDVKAEIKGDIKPWSVVVNAGNMSMAITLAESLLRTTTNDPMAQFVEIVRAGAVPVSEILIEGRRA